MRVIDAPSSAVAVPGVQFAPLFSIPKELLVEAIFFFLVYKIARMDSCVYYE